MFFCYFNRRGPPRVPAPTHPSLGLMAGCLEKYVSFIVCCGERPTAAFTPRCGLSPEGVKAREEAGAAPPRTRADPSCWDKGGTLG